MNTKTIVILFAITVVVLMMTVDEANAQGRCRRRCRGGPADKCVACGSRCPPTCSNRNPTCTTQCVRNVCQCQRGWVRARNGRCVRPNQCRRGM